MTKEQEYKLKEMADKEFGGEIGASQQTLNQGCAERTQIPSMPSLRERIHDQRYRAQVESRRAEQLGELECLLDKNPETARILELLEQVKF